MTTQELHIQLDILLQKIYSNSNKDFLPQEKDYLINREINKFIRQRFNPKSNNKLESIFDIIQRNQDLNSLIRTIPVTIDNINQKEVAYQLPFDYLTYIGTEAKVYPICKDETLPTQNKTTYYASVSPLVNVNGITSVDLFITVSDTIYQLFSLAMLPLYYLPQDNIEDYKKAFIYNNAILKVSKLNSPSSLEIRFNNELQEFEFKSPFPISVSYDVDSNPQNVTYWETETTVPLVDSPLGASVRLVSEEFKADIRKSYLSGSTNESVVGYLRENQVWLMNPKSGVVTSAELTYICKPTPVDLLLNINSNLPNEILDQVISNTAESMKAIISSDTYEKFAKDNELIE